MDKNDLSLYFSFFNEIGIISQLSRALMDARMPEGLSGSHFAVLNHLIRVGDGKTPLALARAFQVPKTTMTHTLGGLITHKLVDMRPNPQDGRSKCTWLTKKGHRFRNQVIADLEPDLARIANQVPKGKIANLVRELTDIRKMLDAARGE